jgi:hypothetical protein
LGFSTCTDTDEFVFDAGETERVEIRVRDQYLITHLFAGRCPSLNVVQRKRHPVLEKSRGREPSQWLSIFYSAVITLQNGKTVAFLIHSMKGVKMGG